MVGFGVKRGQLWVMMGSLDRIGYEVVVQLTVKTTKAIDDWFWSSCDSPGEIIRQVPGSMATLRPSTIITPQPRSAMNISHISGCEWAGHTSPGGKTARETWVMFGISPFRSRTRLLTHGLWLTGSSGNLSRWRIIMDGQILVSRHRLDQKRLTTLSLEAPLFIWSKIHA